MKRRLSSSFVIVKVLQPYFPYLPTTYSAHSKNSTSIVMQVALLVQILGFLLCLQVSKVVSDGETTSSTTSAHLLDLECGKHEKCFQCIQTLGCLWCKDKNLSLESRRCFSNLSHGADCVDNVNPKGAVKKSNLGNNDKVHGETQIHPKEVLLSLRKGEKVNISLQYTDEKHRPLDLYIVMDLSYTMKKHKDKVANLANLLVENLKTLTSDLRMGFGSFVDKPLAPFGFITPPDTSKKSQAADDDERIFTYSFRNHLNLTDDVLEFVEGVNSTGISSNIDYPEGTLDGLLQSTVCTEQIGWRTSNGNRRRLVVISTDGSYHFAGDGKLVGVVLPHDGVCHIDSAGMYTHAAALDYPSVSLVRQKIRENDVFVIFAVTKDQESTYRQLSEHLDPFAVTRGIDDDNSINEVIETEYKKLVNTVTLLSKYNQKEYIDIKFYAQCPGREFEKGNQCDEVGPGVSVNFTVEIELKHCPSTRDLWESVVTIYPQSSTDYMTINLSMLCGCDCEAENPVGLLTETKISNSTVCSGKGFLQCGICECEPKWGGPFCNCSMSDSSSIDKNECIDPKTHLVCNERGRCDSCGVCRCDPGNGNINEFGGKYCQCNNTACPSDVSDEGLCNINATGQSHGHCECSGDAALPSCVCKEGFKGSRCECPTGAISEKLCEEPNSRKICNERGSCRCGKCECYSSYKGTYCGIQSAKVDGSCEAVTRKAAPCVECLKLAIGNGNSDGPRHEKCKEECKQVSLKFETRIGAQGESDCAGSEIDERGCRIDYIIRGMNITNEEIYLEMESTETVLLDKCPPLAPLVEIVSGIIGAMILIGLLLLLLWKLVTHLKDRQEYERFEKSIQQASWNAQENPLYKGTTSQFQNPAYVHFDESEAIS